MQNTTFTEIVEMKRGLLIFNELTFFIFFSAALLFC